MAKRYPLQYEQLYNRIVRTTGLTKEEINIFILKITKEIINNLHHDGKAIVPFLGKFSLKRMPPRKRKIKDFGTGEYMIIQVPAEDKLKFEINKEFRKIFK